MSADDDLQVFGVEVSDVSAVGEIPPEPPRRLVGMYSAPRTVLVATVAWLGCALLSLLAPFLTFFQSSFSSDGFRARFWYTGWGTAHMTSSSTDGASIEAGNGHSTRFGIALAIVAIVFLAVALSVHFVESVWPLLIGLLAGGCHVGVAAVVVLDATAFLSGRGDGSHYSVGAGVYLVSVATLAALVGSAAAVMTVARALRRPPVSAD
ncbi:MAG: hypothetical protein ACR2KJ_01455 [Jatrophihabitans sp.]